MSYILDALRKADQQRHRGATPTLLTAQAASVAPAKSGFSLNGWIAIALILVGIVIGWLRPWHKDPSLRTPESALASPPPMHTNPAAAENTPTAMPMPVPLSPAPQAEAVVKAAAQPPPPTADAPLARLEVPPMPQGSVIIAPADSAVPLPEEPAGKSGMAGAPGKRVLAVSELPASVRQEVGKLAISFHVYANSPVERRIMINNVLLLQGDVLEPGFRVQEITPAGVILAYKGYSFLHTVR